MSSQARRLTFQPWNHLQRINQPDLLLEELTNKRTINKTFKLFFWHHFDNKGRVPKSWRGVFKILSKRGWVIVISSSNVSQNDEESLKKLGCVISKRLNIGLCLGAYRDFCCLLHENRNSLESIESLILCNDSTLPIGGAEKICTQINEIDLQIQGAAPTLMGMTDSVQTNSYHIQSYFLAVNSALLENKCWFDFWTQMNPSGTKDDLIQTGEVGLSQWLLKQNVTIKALYPLTSVLLQQPEARKELEHLDVRTLEQINTTLMCWRALLEAGCPLIKKQLLLEPPLFLPRVAPITELSEHLSEKDSDLRKDLHDLIQTRYLKAW